jgi:hypothetical protein
MTPKQKAEQIVESMSYSCRECDYEAKAKQCALIAVDEILKICVDSLGLNDLDYWQDVKEEIEAI